MSVDSMSLTREIRSLSGLSGSESDMPVVFMQSTPETECIPRNRMSSFGFLGFVLAATNAVVNIANNINDNNNNRNNNNNNNNNNQVNTNIANSANTQESMSMAKGGRVLKRGRGEKRKNSSPGRDLTLLERLRQARDRVLDTFNNDDEKVNMTEDNDTTDTTDTAEDYPDYNYGDDEVQSQEDFQTRELEALTLMSELYTTRASRQNRKLDDPEDLNNEILGQFATVAVNHLAVYTQLSESVDKISSEQVKDAYSYITRLSESYGKNVALFSKYLELAATKYLQKHYQK